MRFFSESDFITYRSYLLKSVNEAVRSLTDNDRSIRAVLIGEFHDGQYRFITVHPFSKETHVHHPEYDHYASLVTDMVPPGMNMIIIEVENDSRVLTEAKGCN